MKTYVHTQTSLQLFITALFLILKEWNQPKCPPIEEWNKKCVISTQWNIILHCKGMKDGPMLQG